MPDLTARLRMSAPYAESPTAATLQREAADEIAKITAERDALASTLEATRQESERLREALRETLAAQAFRPDAGPLRTAVDAWNERWSEAKAAAERALKGDA